MNKSFLKEATDHIIGKLKGIISDAEVYKPTFNIFIINHGIVIYNMNELFQYTMVGTIPPATDILT